MKRFVLNLLKNIIAFLNRIAHFIDIFIFLLFANYISNTYNTGNWKYLSILIYILPIYMTYRAIKYEILIIKSKNICIDMLNNSRVMGFCGKQGAGKSSFSAYLATLNIFSNVYSNTPLKLNNKYTYMLEKDILNLDSRINDYSLIYIDEATIFYHNILNSSKQEIKELYPQEILGQCVRHFYDGNIFYISVDITRLPKVLKDNVGLTCQMLGQGNKHISLFIGYVLEFLVRPFDKKFYNGLRFWDFQTFENITESNYTFDLSNQEKDTNTKNYANLLTVYTWNNALKFEYNDRFLNGLYCRLPKHHNKKWNNLKFDDKKLANLGYGELLKFFEEKSKD